eukprot:2419446-Pyramimonas_sp.AAC.1
MTVTCAYPTIAQRVCRALGKFGYRYVSALEVLGIEVTSGRALRFQRLRARVRKMSTRFPRLRRVRKAGALTGKFAKSAVPAALNYGVGVH